jgi:hypothetical protein
MKLYYGIKIADILLQSVLWILKKFLRIFHDEFPEVTLTTIYCHLQDSKMTRESHEKVFSTLPGYLKHYLSIYPQWWVYMSLLTAITVPKGLAFTFKITSSPTT